jgi:anti-sigma factor ChrR (cupin superfamily)
MNLTALLVDEAAPAQVGPGCSLRRLPSSGPVRAWVADMAPGSRWPVLDVHEFGELVYVVSGELIENGHRYGPGTYMHYPPGSSHQPRTDLGVRLFGVNPTSA